MRSWIPVIAAALIIGMLGGIAKKLAGARPGTLAGEASTS